MSNAEQMDKAELNLRYIYAKLPGATEEQLRLLAVTIQGLGVNGFDHEEYHRELPINFSRTKE